MPFDQAGDSVGGLGKSTEKLSGLFAALPVAGGRGVRVPLQMIGRGDRLAILVGAQEAGIEGVAREVEVVGVAAKERDVFFRGKRQAHVLVALVLVQVASFVNIVHRPFVNALAVFGFQLLDALLGRGVYLVRVAFFSAALDLIRDVVAIAVEIEPVRQAISIGIFAAAAPLMLS